MWLEIAAKLSFALVTFGVGLGVLVALTNYWDDRHKAYISRKQQLDELDEIRKEGF